MVHRLILCLAALLATPLAHAGPPLTYEQILAELPGVWVMIPRDAAAPPMSQLCETASTRISIRQSGANAIYLSEFLGVLPDGKVDEDRFSRSAIRRVAAAPGFGMEGIHVQYEGEDRLDDNGRPVAWILFMPDRDTFYWHMVGWPRGATTVPSRRCPDPDLIG